NTVNIGIVSIINRLNRKNQQRLSQNDMKKTILFLLLVINGLMCSFAQSSTGVEMATGLRSSGKIYVVVAVLAVLFIGLAIYLFTIDKKLSRLEKHQER